jgi:hypothetical protein
MHRFENSTAHEPRLPLWLLLLATVTVLASSFPLGLPLILAPRPSFAVGTAVLFVWSGCCALGMLFSTSSGVRAGIPVAIAALLLIWTVLLIVSVGLLLVPALVCWSILAVYELRHVKRPKLPADVVVMAIALVFCVPIGMVVAFAFAH